jgi:hypothetical protein
MISFDAIIMLFIDYHRLSSIIGFRKVSSNLIEFFQFFFKPPFALPIVVAIGDHNYGRLQMAMLLPNFKNASAEYLEPVITW